MQPVEWYQLGDLHDGALMYVELCAGRQMQRRVAIVQRVCTVFVHAFGLQLDVDRLMHRLLQLKLWGI